MIKAAFKAAFLCIYHAIYLHIGIWYGGLPGPSPLARGYIYTKSPEYYMALGFCIAHTYDCFLTLPSYYQYEKLWFGEI
jgi:hypothetical protein